MACGRRGAANGASHRAVSASLPKESTQRRIRKLLSHWTSGCPVRALRSAAGRRVHWKSRRYLRLVFLIFGVYRRETRAALSILLEQAARARANRRKSMRCDGLVGRTGPGTPPGRLFRPLARGFALMHAARRSTKGADMEPERRPPPGPGLRRLAPEIRSAEVNHLLCVIVAFYDYVWGFHKAQFRLSHFHPSRIHPFVSPSYVLSTTRRRVESVQLYCVHDTVQITVLLRMYRAVCTAPSAHSARQQTDLARSKYSRNS